MAESVGGALPVFGSGLHLKFGASWWWKCLLLEQKKIVLTPLLVVRSLDSALVTSNRLLSDMAV